MSVFNTYEIMSVITPYFQTSSKVSSACDDSNDGRDSAVHCDTQAWC